MVARRQGDTGARADANRDPIEHARVGERGHELASDVDERLVVLGVRREGELVTPQAGHDAAATETRFEAATDDAAWEPGPT